MANVCRSIQYNIVSKPILHSIGINCKPTTNVKAIQLAPYRVSSGQQVSVSCFSKLCQTTALYTHGINLQHACLENRGLSHL